MSVNGKKALIEKIRREIREKGKITFARFMEMALYDPEQGYYTSGRDPIGWRGDYYTSPEVHPVFGRLIAKQLVPMLESLGDAGPLTVLEMGAGRGLLAREILVGLRKQSQTLFERVQYVIIERSPSMIARQKVMLASEGLDQMVARYESLADVKAGGGLIGCLVSNEVVDAFPVHRVVMTERGLREIYVGADDDRLVEVVDSVSTEALPSYFDRLKIRLAPGQQAEANLEAIRWIKAVGQSLSKGYVLTFDYGHTAADLYAPHRKKGSLLCYYRHTANEDPYARIGEQDITAHVDFSSLAEAGREAGLELTGFTNQQHFLMGLGIAQEMEGLDSESPAFRAMKRLISDDRMGRTFKVLIQHKGLIPPPFEGLRFRPYFNQALL
jgi:SAM-dependent MidA family methyltransferase